MLPDWLEILTKCSESMKEQVRLLLGKTEAGVEHERGAGGDVTKEVDRVAEDALFETLSRYDVSCTVVSEESGVKRIGGHASEFYVVTDPVDGTTNAVRGLPFMAVSIAVSRKPRLSNVETALVADVLRDTTYTAEKGRGAVRNGKEIKPSETVTLEDAVVGVDLSNFKARSVVDRLMSILVETRHLRHLGANALEICYVADGTTDAFIDIRGKLRVTDMAAAYLVLREAGGTITTTDGDQLEAKLEATERVSFVAAANKSIHHAILERIKAAKGSEEQ